MEILEELKVLNDFGTEDNTVLSLYLNTDPSDPEQRKGAWRIHLKNELKELEQMLPSSANNSERKLFKATKEKVVKEIDDNQTDLNKGIIIFASIKPELWSVHYVQVRVKTGFYWGKKPELEQLHYMNKAYPKSGVILPGRDEVRILDTSMGVVNDELFYEFDASSEHWKQKKGVAYGATRASGVAHKNAYDDRIRENLLRFYKELGAMIAKLSKERKWEEIHVSGEAELANAFSKVLTKEPKSCLYKNLNNSEPNVVLNEVFEK